MVCIFLVSSCTLGERYLEDELEGVRNVLDLAVRLNVEFVELRFEGALSYSMSSRRGSVEIRRGRVFFGGGWCGT